MVEEVTAGVVNKYANFLGQRAGEVSVSASLESEFPALFREV